MLNGHHRITAIIAAAFFVCSLSPAQTTAARTLKPTFPEGTRNFTRIRDEAEALWRSKNTTTLGTAMENGAETKVAGWKLFKRWEYYWEQRIDQQTGNFPQTSTAAELMQYQQSRRALNKKSTLSSSWTNLGTNTSSGGYAGLGRINCVAFHPADTNTIWVGSPSGGLWKSTNGGSSWSILNGNETILGVSDIAVPSDYATSQTLYIATGDRDGGSLWSLGGGEGADNPSIGVLKSTDGGATWNTTGLSYTQSVGKKIYRLLIDPTNNTILLAATSDGIYKSTNSGATWTSKTGNVWDDVEFKPGDHTILIAGSRGYSSSYVNRSTDNGETWSLFAVASGGYRTEVAVSAADPSVVYLLCANSSGGVAGIYRSTDSGLNFTRKDDGTKSMLGYYSDGSGANTGQGTYDLCIAVAPTDANVVHIGGVNGWKSTDAGVTWNAVNMWTSSGTYNKNGAAVVHADKHTLAFQTPYTLFEGNDGGIYRTRNGGSTWTDISNGLVISQIYRIGVSKTDPNIVLAGLQDNGSKKYRGTANTWVDASGGDGMECIVDLNNASSYMYSTYVSGTIYRNTNGFTTQSTTTISNNIPGKPAGAWVTPYIMNPYNSRTLYAGYDTVYRTTDRGDTWSVISQSLSTSNKLRSLAVAPSDTNVLYAADLTHLWKTTNGGTTNWSAVTLPTTATSVTYIAVKNTDPNTLWITYGGYSSGSKVYQSTDGGANWTNISTGLPNLPVLCVVYDKSVVDQTTLFVGTDAGVYVKYGTNDWEPYSTGLPNVVVTELEILYGATDKLRAGTFGRGLWETPITAPLPVELTSFTAAVAGTGIRLQWATATERDCRRFDVERKEKEDEDEGWTMVGIVEGAGTSSAPHEYLFLDNGMRPGTYSYRLRQVDGDGKVHLHFAADVAVNVTTMALEQNFPNPFNPSTVIGYQVPVRQHVTLTVFDAIGRTVATLLNEEKSAGRYTAVFNAAGLSNGVYFARLTAGSRTITQRMLLVK